MSSGKGIQQGRITVDNLTTSGLATQATAAAISDALGGAAGVKALLGVSNTRLSDVSTAVAGTTTAVAALKDSFEFDTVSKALIVQPYVAEDNHGELMSNTPEGPSGLNNLEDSSACQPLRNGRHVTLFGHVTSVNGEGTTVLEIYVSAVGDDVDGHWFKCTHSSGELQGGEDFVIDYETSAPYLKVKFTTACVAEVNYAIAP